MLSADASVPSTVRSALDKKDWPRFELKRVQERDDTTFQFFDSEFGDEHYSALGFTRLEVYMDDIQRHSFIYCAPELHITDVDSFFAHVCMPMLGANEQV
jgi:hypothetical protein